MEPLPEKSERRLAAIMFTDMVGYSALTQSNEAKAMEVLERHNRILRPFFPRFNGREVKAIGDSFLVEFDSALDALRCAEDIQSHLHDYNLSTEDEWKIRLRIGIHLGDVIHQHDDVFGDAVNIASRMEPLAEPEGICISEQVYDQVSNKFELALVPLGHRSLKNVERPVEVYKVELPWSGAEGPTNLESNRLAVLPFVSISPDPGDEYFADGLTEELIGRLSLVRGLDVIARTSVMNYKKQAKSAAQIGRELKAGTLLEGSVRKAGNRIRVTAQLINANNESHMWMENFDRNLDDIFAVQSEVAEKVAGSLQLKLSERDRSRIQRDQTKDIEAYSLYLKGRFYLARWDEESLKAALDNFNRALAKDPNYALAYTGLAFSYLKLGFQDIMSPEETIQKAEENARKALEIDDSLAEAHLALYRVLARNFTHPGSLKEVHRALELNPNLADAHGMLAAYHAFRLEWDECIREIEKELELDPFSVSSLGTAGTWYLYAGHYDKAIKYLEDALELDPKNSFNLDNLGLAHIQRGELEEGLAMVKKSVEMAEAPSMYGDLAYAYVKAGKPEEARKLLSESESMIRNHKRISSTSMAGIYAVLGEKEKAMDWLEKAYEEKSGYIQAVNGDLIYENIKDEPRFKALIDKMGLASPGKS